MIFSRVFHQIFNNKNYFDTRIAYLEEPVLECSSKTKLSKA